jgi:hypothetical protein
MLPLSSRRADKHAVGCTAAALLGPARRGEEGEDGGAERRSAPQFGAGAREHRICMLLQTLGAAARRARAERVPEHGGAAAARQWREGMHGSPAVSPTPSEMCCGLRRPSAPACGCRLAAASRLGFAAAAAGAAGARCSAARRRRAVFSASPPFAAAAADAQQDGAASRAPSILVTCGCSSCSCVSLPLGLVLHAAST